MRVLFLSSHPLGEEAARYTWEIVGDHQFSWCISDEKFDFSNYDDPYDLGVSFLYTHLIPADQIRDKNWINFHPAPLPEYRGRNVAYHAILNGETEFGATLHYVDATFDTGDIIAVKNFAITRDMHAGDVARKAREMCLELFKEYIPQFLMGKKPQGFRQLGGTYYKKKPIDPNVLLLSEQVEQIRAITAPPHYATTDIYGVKYVIIPASQLHHPVDESSGTIKTDVDWFI